MNTLGAGGTAPKLALALLLALALPLALADTLRVGPHEALSRIADAARLAKDGDTVEILPGGWFLRIHGDKFPTPPRLDIGDNETHGIGILTPTGQTGR